MAMGNARTRAVAPVTMDLVLSAAGVVGASTAVALMLDHTTSTVMTMATTVLALSVSEDLDTMEWESMDMDTVLTPDPMASQATTVDHSASDLEATVVVDMVTADVVDHHPEARSISCASSELVLDSP
jgi:hypothetical protein